MNFYICPVCKTKNGDKDKYCIKCGTWLLSSTFPAKKQKSNNFRRYYICSFCDTPNEPNRNACKKCFKPLFSTEYETKEVVVKRTGSKWLKTIFIVIAVIVGIYIFKPTAQIDRSIQNTNNPHIIREQNSRTSPAEIGKKVSGEITQSDLLSTSENSRFNVDVTILSVIRGDEAWNKIKAANQFNQPPKDGYEYLMAQIKVKVNKSDGQDAQLNLNNAHFSLVSSDGKEYPPVVLVVNDSINAKLYAGAEHTGWAVFTVLEDDPDPIIAFARDQQGRGGVWFKTK